MVLSGGRNLNFRWWASDSRNEDVIKNVSPKMEVPLLYVFSTRFRVGLGLSHVCVCVCVWMSWLRTTVPHVAKYVMECGIK
jgi:hypothetical protein